MGKHVFGDIFFSFTVAYGMTGRIVNMKTKPGAKMRALLVVLALGLMTGLMLGGCSNTFEGVGRDVERAGQGIQRTF